MELGATTLHREQHTPTRIGGKRHRTAGGPEIDSPPRRCHHRSCEQPMEKSMADEGMLLITGPGPHELPVADAVTIFDTSDPDIVAIAVEFLIPDQGIPTIVRIPMQNEQAAQLFALLQAARRRGKWPKPRGKVGVVGEGQ
jgi:hypothetical protein